MATVVHHPMQIEIFERLRTARKGLRFSEMCPEGIETDHYNYHLKQLIKRGYITKQDRNYLLTDLGRELLADLFPLTQGRIQQHKIAAMCMALREGKTGTEVLYQKRTREPHYGSIAMVAGGVKRGESMLAAAKRRLWEEAGLVMEDPKWVGTLRVIRLRPEDDSPWSDITYHICVSREVSGALGTTKFGEHMWLSLMKAASLERSPAIGSHFLADILERLEADPTILERGFYREEVDRSGVW